MDYNTGSKSTSVDCSGHPIADLRWMGGKVLPITVKNGVVGVPVVAQWLTNPTRNHEVAGSIPALLRGLRIWCCRELWCWLQMQLRSGVAVALALAGGYSSDLTPSLGTSMCHGSGPRKGKHTHTHTHTNGVLERFTI